MTARTAELIDVLGRDSQRPPRFTGRCTHRENRPIRTPSDDIVRRVRIGVLKEYDGLVERHRNGRTVCLRGSRFLRVLWIIWIVVPTATPDTWHLKGRLFVRISSRDRAATAPTVSTPAAIERKIVPAGRVFT